MIYDFFDELENENELLTMKEFRREHVELTLNIMPIESVAVKKLPVVKRSERNNKYSKPKIMFSFP